MSDGRTNQTGSVVADKRRSDDETAERLSRVLLLAYAFEPGCGSEQGLGWNRVLDVARRYVTYVICKGDAAQAVVERALADQEPNPNLHVVFISNSALGKFLGRIPGLFYLSYNLWHRRAYRVARRLHAEVGFDLVHQLNIIGFREPGYLWKLDALFVWGPVGGTQNYPWRFLPYAGFAGALSEAFRSVLNEVQLRLSRRVRRAAAKSACVVAANRSIAHDLSRTQRVTPHVMTETGATAMPEGTPHDCHHTGGLRILWSGVFEHRKALHLLLHALAQLPAGVPYELRILGRGPLERRWRRIARQNGIEAHCRWLGWIPHDEAREQFRWADVFAFTSLRDTTGTVVLESLVSGTPLLCLDHQGVGDAATDECAMKVPVTTPREVIAGLRDAIVRLQTDRRLLERLSRGAVARGGEFVWARQGERMAALYRQLLPERGRAAVPREKEGQVKAPSSLPSTASPLPSSHAYRSASREASSSQPPGPARARA